MIEILLVDDHPSVMEGTKVLLEQEADMQVSLAQSGIMAKEILGLQHVDVMLIDLHMPDISGIDLAKQILAMKPTMIVLIYTGFEFKDHFNLMIDSGISGFVLKTANKEQLVTAIRCAMRDEMILPHSLVRQLRRTKERISERVNEAGAITEKEYDILKQLAKGKSNKDIAELMFMSQRSLEYAITHLFQKLNVKSRIEAAMKAKQMGLLADTDFIVKSSS
jgi:two-component system competent response regulator ComA